MNNTAPNATFRRAEPQKFHETGDPEHPQPDPPPPRFPEPTHPNPKPLDNPELPPTSPQEPPVQRPRMRCPSE